MDKNYLPLTVQYAETVKAKSSYKNDKVIFIAVKKLQTTKATPDGFHRPISKILSDD